MTDSVAKILGLGQYADNFHPLAVKKYREFIDDISKDVPLENITEDDVKEFLSGLGYYDYEYSKNSLSEWLKHCLLTNDEVTLKSYSDSFPIWGTLGFKNLLVKVYKAKQYCQNVADAKVWEQSRIQQEARRLQEQTQQETRRKDLERKRAQEEHSQWIDLLNKNLDNAKAKLSKNTVPDFQQKAWLKSYQPEVWVKELSGPTEDWFVAKTELIVTAFKATLWSALQRHLDVKFLYRDYHVPTVQYEAVSPAQVSGKAHQIKPKTMIPCLKLRLATYIIAIVEIYVTEGPINDRRYGYDFQDQSSADKLGDIYYGPVFWKYQDDFVITPLSLLAKVACGKAAMPGVEVVRRIPPLTVYRVEGFHDEISLNDDFCRFLCDMVKNDPLDKALLERKMCDKETAKLVADKLANLNEPEGPATKSVTSSEPKTGDPYTDVVIALQGMGYPNGAAVKEANYVCQEFPEEPIKNKIEIAVQHLSK